MKKLIVAVVLLAAVAAGGYSYYRYSKRPIPPTVTTAAVTRGDVVESVSATGTLQAVTTVQVGSQVSGNIAFLGADFNSIVKKGQVLARLDPSLFEAQAQQQRANLAQARANYQRSLSDLDRTKVQLTDAQQKYARATELSARNLLPKSDLDTAKTALDSAQASLQSQQATVTQTQASITQAEASVNQTQVNLDHTVITSPIDGLVISRSVDVGQTVAASMQAPTLFVLAADLTKMQVVANLDESDVGRIRPNQTVSFRVDAYPTQTFRGTVSQVRLEPKVQQNVVTYATVIDVPNNNLLLKPGMTANVDVEISKASNVLRIPNSALRFRPSNDVFTAFGQTPPEPQRRGGGRGGAPGASDPQGAPAAAAPSASPIPSAPPAATTTARADANVAAAPAREPQGTRAAASGEGSVAPPAQSGSRPGGAPAGTPGSAPSTGRGAGPAGTPGSGQAGDGSNGDRRNRFAERLQNMSPEERDAAMARMRERGIDPDNPGAGFGRPGGLAGPDGQNAGDAAGAGQFGRGGAPGAGANDQTARFGRGGGPGQTTGQPSAGSLATGRASALNSSPTANAGRRSPQPSADAAGATTIDAMFAPLSHPTSRGAVWLFVDSKLERVPLMLGVSDGQNTEVIDGNVKEGTDVVTNVAIAGQTTRPATTAFPGFGGGRQGFPAGGFGGGGGGNGGGRGR